MRTEQRSKHNNFFYTEFNFNDYKKRCKGRPNAAYQTKKIQDKNKTFYFPYSLFLKRIVYY